MLNHLRDGLQREHLAARGNQQLLHVLAAHPEAAAGDTRNNLEARSLSLSYALRTEGSKMLNARHLVPRRAVILSDLGLESMAMTKVPVVAATSGSSLT